MNLTYKCSVCATVILNISEFQKHLSNCTSSNGVKSVNVYEGDSVYCGICCVSMPDIRDIQQKLETKNHDSDYYRTSFDTLNCLMCHRVFLTIGDLCDHQRKDHFDSKYEKRFACIRCLNKTNKFAQISNPTNSINPTTKDNIFCSICDKFIKLSAWSRHERNHRDRVVYQCESCQKIRIGFLRFQNHFRQSARCSNSMELNVEKVEKEPKNYTYQCTKCGETFSRRSFKSHIEDSDCYAENKCLTCSKRFMTISALNEHRLVDCTVKFEKRNTKKDQKSKTIRCEICNIDSDAKHFIDFHHRKSVVRLKRTIIDRMERKPSAGIQFACLLCDETFTDRQQLRGHMKTHCCDKSVQTVPDSQCEITWDLMDADSKQCDALQMKDEKIESLLTTAANENDFPTDTDLVKTETTPSFENLWTLDVDHFDDFTNDDPGEMSDEPTNTHTTQYNANGVTKCCLCTNSVPDLINSDEVVQEQIAKFGETICLVCFQSFNQSDKLRDHESSHFQDNLDGHLIACRSCAWSLNVYYTDDDYFRLENELQCYMCAAKMCDLRTLRRHKRSHLSLCVFTCKVCNKKSISDERHRNHLRKHQKTELTVVTNQIIRKCTVCGDEATNLFRDEKDIDRMFDKFNGGPCKICYTYINDKKRYISHERGHMDEQQLVACYKCCNTQPYTDDEYHQLEDDNTCFICKAKLSSKYNLHLHKRKHLDRVVYTCSICLSLVVGTRNHSHHMYKHGVRKKHREEETGQFECDYCGKIFPHKSSLPAHFKQHLNKQRVPCPQCTLTFASKGNLTQHIKQIHLNIRKHICELCGKAFGHPHNLKSHMVKHSGEKVS